MKGPDPAHPLYLGMRAGDLEHKPFAKYWNPDIAPLSAAAREALACGPVASALLCPLQEAKRLLEPGHHLLEDGFGFAEDGSLYVAIRTPMPKVSPAMIDWWFGWHGAEPQRYKLWHPRAHVHAQWAEPIDDEARKVGRERYVGRVSFVDEYLGSRLSHISIAFRRPSKLDFDERALADPEQATVVCARIGFAGRPLDVGWLVHHVRRAGDGSEMRSRFWLGGRHASLRGLGTLGEAVARTIARFVKPTIADGRNLLVHCAQEMAHLASFLPAIHSELRDSP